MLKKYYKLLKVYFTQVTWFYFIQYYFIQYYHTPLLPPYETQRSYYREATTGQRLIVPRQHCDKQA